jgi:hypothetical protein
VKSRAGLVLAVVCLLATPSGTACAQPALSCPAGTQPVSRPLGGGRMEHCRSAAGTPEGPMLSTHANGQRRLEGQYHDGKADGRWRGWHPSGRPAGEADFQSGQLRRVVAWYENGTQAFEGDMTAGRMVVFDAQGRRRMVTEVVAGNATERFWDDQGREISEPPDLGLDLAVQDFMKTIFLIGGVPPH